MDSCVFRGNVASSGDGGAVRTKGGELMIVGGEFFGNSATRNGARRVGERSRAGGSRRYPIRGEPGAAGGWRLYFDGASSEDSTSPTAAASCSLSEAVFRSKNATRAYLDSGYYYTVHAPWVQLNGGGVALSTATWSASWTRFELNYAQLSDGGLYGGIDSNMTINGSTFNDNRTPGYGGGMAASTATLGGGTVVTKNSVEAHGAGVWRLMVVGFCGVDMSSWVSIQGLHVHQVFGWDETGMIELHDFLCTDKTAANGNGGYFYVSGGGIVNDIYIYNIYMYVYNDGTVMMRNNEGKLGGRIRAS